MVIPFIMSAKRFAWGLGGVRAEGDRRGRGVSMREREVRERRASDMDGRGGGELWEGVGGRERKWDRG